jgi:L-threonylcarbamoyladenylate synthase
MSTIRPRLRQAAAHRPTDADLDAAARVLADGGLVIVPTETVYGIAAHPLRADAVRKLAEVKGRDAGKPIALLADSIAAVERCGIRWSSAARRLAEAFWPGPLTLVLDLEGAGEPEGFRVPDCALTQALLTRCGGTLRVSSANRSGEPDARDAADALRALGNAVDMALDAGRVRGGTPSTVVRVAGETVTVLREGALDAKRIMAVACRGRAGCQPARRVGTERPERGRHGEA